MPNKKQQAAALRHGWRSGLEEQVANQLRKAKIRFRYESVVLPYVEPETVHRYTPDFILPNGIVVETKGRWVTKDRKKIKLFIAQHPDIDFRIVFSNSRTRISKQSKTTYAKFCKTQGIPYADRYIPVSWLKEPVNKKSLRAIVSADMKRGRNK